MKRAEELRFANRKDWRTWLKENCDTKEEVWLVYYKKHADKPSVSYDDSVEEALCFGWVDSIIRRIDDVKFARKFTPRKAASKWSEANKKRAEKMVKEGKMTLAGLAKVEEAKESGRWFKTHPTKKDLAVPSYFMKALAGNKKAVDNFNRLAPSYKRNAVAWIESAKREETRERRVAEFIGLLEQNKKLGMK
jgi:uncharacterized protein YdeI (YjbR/CyaY-like superfamily)